MKMSIFDTDHNLSDGSSLTPGGVNRSQSADLARGMLTRAGHARALMGWSRPITDPEVSFLVRLWAAGHGTSEKRGRGPRWRTIIGRTALGRLGMVKSVAGKPIRKARSSQPSPCPP